jgi:hypothetical protein
VPSNNSLIYRELGFDFLNGDLYIGDSNNKPLLIAKSGIMSKLKVENGNLVLDGTVITTNISVDTATLAKVIINEPYRGTEDPNDLTDLDTDDGTLYFRIV